MGLTYTQSYCHPTNDPRCHAIENSGNLLPEKLAYLLLYGLKTMAAAIHSLCTKAVSKFRKRIVLSEGRRHDIYKGDHLLLMIFFATHKVFANINLSSACGLFLAHAFHAGIRKADTSFDFFLILS